MVDVRFVMFPEPELILADLKRFFVAVRQVVPGSKLGVTTVGWNSPKIRSIWDTTDKVWLKEGPWVPDKSPMLRELEEFAVAQMEQQGVWIVASWLNLVQKGGQVLTHDHVSGTNAFASVYHMEGVGDLVFPEIDTRFSPVPGQLTIWPVHVKHCVDPVTSEEDRLSVAMNFSRQSSHV